MAAGKPIGVVDNPEKHRYELTVGDDLAGVSVYRDDGSVRTFVHTEVEPRYEGQGLAGRLATAALDDVRARGLTVVASCPYVAQFIQRHPEYQDLRA